MGGRNSVKIHIFLNFGPNSNESGQSSALPGEKSLCESFPQLFYQDSFILDLVTGGASVVEYSAMCLGASS